MLLVHDDEPDALERREHRRPRADDDVDVAAADAVPLVVALAVGQAAVLDGDALAERVAEDARPRPASARSRAPARAPGARAASVSPASRRYTSVLPLPVTPWSSATWNCPPAASTASRSSAACCSSVSVAVRARPSRRRRATKGARRTDRARRAPAGRRRARAWRAASACRARCRGRAARTPGAPPAPRERLQRLALKVAHLYSWSYWSSGSFGSFRSASCTRSFRSFRSVRAQVRRVHRSAGPLPETRLRPHLKHLMTRVHGANPKDLKAPTDLLPGRPERPEGPADPMDLR